jgi:pimeloyl-ACP methyl ester carboxylesterase
MGDEGIEAGWLLGYSRAFIDANRLGMLERSRASSELAAPRDSYMRGVLASARHDAWDRLHEITCPVMIVHGAEDVMIPVGNAHMLKERIPHAELHILEGLGHGYNLEGQRIADDLVIGFVKRNTHEGARSAVR